MFLVYRLRHLVRLCNDYLRPSGASGWRLHHPDMRRNSPTCGVSTVRSSSPEASPLSAVATGTRGMSGGEHAGRISSRRRN